MFGIKGGQANKAEEMMALLACPFLLTSDHDAICTDFSIF